MSGTKIKVLVVGDYGTGKTSLCLTCLNKEFPVGQVPVVMDNAVVRVTCGCHEVFLDVHDVAGAEDYDRLGYKGLLGTQVVILAYAIDNPFSFDGVISTWMGEILGHCLPGIPILLVATKFDLRKIQRETLPIETPLVLRVTVADGIQCAKELGAFGYAEVSSKNKIGVETVFQMAAGAVLYPKVFTDFWEPKKGNSFTDFISKLWNKPKYANALPNGRSLWNLLPQHALVYIGTLLPFSDFGTYLLVNKQIHTICNTEEMWKVCALKTFPFLDSLTASKAFLQNSLKHKLIVSIPQT